MNNIQKFAISTGIVLATTFSLSCSSGNGGDNNNGSDPSSSSGGGNIESVTIGTQVWMKKNLNVEVAGSKCYDDLPANCEKYGRLYTWDMAKTACPNGWKLPSNEDWITLTTSAGTAPGKNLKAASGWNDYTDEGTGEVKSGNGLDTYGFAALPGGACDSSGICARVGENGYWFTSSDNGNGGVTARRMSESTDGVGTVNGTGLHNSVRCIKDN